MFRYAVDMVRRVTPKQSQYSSPSNKDWPIYERYLNHLLSLNTVYTSELALPTTESPQANYSLSPCMEFAELLSDFGNYMWERNLISGALELLDTAEKICRELLPQDNTNPRYTQVLYVIASIELNQGSIKRREGLMHKKQIRDRRQQRYDSFPKDQIPEVDALQLSTAINNFGAAYLHCDDYPAAQPLLDDALRIKSMYGNKHSPHLVSGFAEGYKNLAFVAMFNGDTERALSLSKEACDNLIASPSFGPRTRVALLHRYLRACHLFNAGKVAHALLEHLDVLRIRQEVLGRKHDHTLDSQYAVGYLYSKIGDHEKAEYVVLVLWWSWQSTYNLQRAFACMSRRQGLLLRN
jgi:tetratricopeptide (TPR) repeat protein